jgi:hypothetical protein
MWGHRVSQLSPRAAAAVVRSRRSLGYRLFRIGSVVAPSGANVVAANHPSSGADAPPAPFSGPTRRIGRDCYCRASSATNQVVGQIADNQGVVRQPKERPRRGRRQVVQWKKTRAPSTVQVRRRLGSNRGTSLRPHGFPEERHGHHR